MPISYSKEKLYFFENLPASKAAPTGLPDTAEFFVQECQGSVRLSGQAPTSFAAAMGVRQMTTLKPAQPKTSISPAAPTASPPQKAKAEMKPAGGKAAGDKNFESWSAGLTKWSEAGAPEPPAGGGFSSLTTTSSTRTKAREPWELVADAGASSSSQLNAGGSRLARLEASDIEAQLKAQAAAGAVGHTVSGTFDASSFERNLFAGQAPGAQQQQPVPGTFDAMAFEKQIIAQHQAAKSGDVVDAAALERQLVQGATAGASSPGAGAQQAAGQDLASLEAGLLSKSPPTAHVQEGPMDAAALEKQIFAQRSEPQRTAPQETYNAASLESELMGGGAGQQPAAGAAVFDAAALERQLLSDQRGGYSGFGR
eukprot:TRINITY_DN900_c1_g1_i1.p1 TRINITY_DN900_c1_g1~~TRINITY_DN900_c1_g1_i1.p1  ORF type:complete len:369 (+),score=145.30 TRINITY_DN900_c1_g1_i1:64-1170(+)